MLNDVWLKIAQFLGTLNGENVKRESYVRTPEYEAALEAWKETEQEWEVFLETLPVGEQEKAEEQVGDSAWGGMCAAYGDRDAYSACKAVWVGIV